MPKKTQKKIEVKEQPRPAAVEQRPPLPQNPTEDDKARIRRQALMELRILASHPRFWCVHWLLDDLLGQIEGQLRNPAVLSDHAMLAYTQGAKHVLDQQGLIRAEIRHALQMDPNPQEKVR